MEQEIQFKKNDLLKTTFLISIISLWLYWLWTRRNLYRFAFKFPGTFGSPIIGSFSTIKHFKLILQVITTLMERFKNQTFCIWLGLYPTIVSADPEFIEKVLSSSELLNKATALYLPVYKVFNGGLISSPESEWHRSRKLLNPSFNHKVLLSLLPIFNKASKLTISLMDSMVDNQEHKLANMLLRITMGISVETTMGNEMKNGDQVSEEYSKQIRFMLEKIVPHIMLSCVNMDLVYVFYRKYSNTKRQLHEFVLKLLKLRIENFDEKTTIVREVTDDSLVTIKKTPTIFIDQAIQIYRKDKFTYNDIVAESNNIIAASFETTANGVFSALTMLSMHPDIQERLSEEIVNVFPEKDFEMEYEDMEKLPYLDMVVNETLRLAPSVPVIARQVVQDTRLSKDLTLPKGLQILISIFHVHRNTDVWGPNANKFDPDNFLPENLAGKHAYSYIPFSKGARNCIGWRYAIFALKVMLVRVIRNYRLTTSMKYDDLVYLNHLTLAYSNEPLFKLNRRE